VHEGDCHAAFSHAAGNTLDRGVANVAYTEEAGEICFQQKWSTTCRPTWLVAHLAPRADIAVFALKLSRQPMGYCIGADHDKQRICRPANNRASRILGFDGFQFTTRANWSRTAVAGTGSAAELARDFPDETGGVGTFFSPPFIYATRSFAALRRAYGGLRPM
jgi:hypothetical protein